MRRGRFRPDESLTRAIDRIRSERLIRLDRST
jgi:hypothetical protein